jgi:hypothetical protein
MHLDYGLKHETTAARALTNLEQFCADADGALSRPRFLVQKTAEATVRVPPLTIFLRFFPVMPLSTALQDRARRIRGNTAAKSRIFEENPAIFWYGTTCSNPGLLVFESRARLSKTNLS